MISKCQWCGGTGINSFGFVCHCQRRIDVQELQRGLFSQLQQWRLVQVLRSLMWWLPK